MLTEIALTPQVFQPCKIDGAGWTVQLRALIQRLVHYGNVCPLIFSNLNDGHATAGWLATVTNGLATFKPAEHRTARDLFDRIRREHLVSRPSQHQVLVTVNEDQWVKEAVRPAPNYPIDQIVTSWQGANGCQKIFTKAVPLNDLDKADFWGAITPSAFPLMTITEQIKILRPIWLHGHLLAAVLPYGLESEADWFSELAKQAFARPRDYPRPRLELHVSSVNDDNDLEIKAKGDKYWRVANFLGRITSSLPKGVEFDLYVRAGRHGSQRFIARRLFAGEETNVGTAAPATRIRWGVSLEHVASPRDAANQTSPTFSLLPRQQADNQFRFECQTPGPRLTGPIHVHC